MALLGTSSGASRLKIPQTLKQNSVPEKPVPHLAQKRSRSSALSLKAVLHAGEHRQAVPFSAQQNYPQQHSVHNRQ